MPTPRARQSLIRSQVIERQILVLRGHRVMLDRDLSEILSRSQIATLNRGQNVKYRPYVFTEHGAVMLANVLRSRVAVRASIQVVRAFVNLRRMLATHEDLARKVEAVERRLGKHDVELHDVLRILRKLLEPPPLPPRRTIGFVPPVKGK